MSSMHLINQICAIMQNCIQKKNLDDFFTFFCPALTLDFLFFFPYFFFSSVKSSFGTFGTKGTTTEEGRPPEKYNQQYAIKKLFLLQFINLSRQKDFLLFSLSKILEVLLQVVINAVATF